MSDSFEWRVGEPDDADDAALMRIGIAARRTALKSFKEIQPIVREHKVASDATELVAYQLQGMVQQAAYCAVLCQALLDDMGLEWKQEGEDTAIHKGPGANKKSPTLTRVLYEVGVIANLFSKRINLKEK